MWLSAGRDDIVLDIGEGDKIIGIEILEASSHVDLNNILRFSTRKVLQ
ncbi:MAG: DUF2283 domain-containing protein [Nitrospirae bacterium]|nr:DUF2283 domain-containing protein [Nitrospirota bacterium]